MAVCDPDTQEIIPEGTASRVVCITTTVRSVYPEKGDCPSLPVNAKWNIPAETGMLPKQAMWDWLHDDWRIHPLNKLFPTSWSML